LSYDDDRDYRESDNSSLDYYLPTTKKIKKGRQEHMGTTQLLMVNVESNNDNEKDTRKGKLEKRSRKAPGSIFLTEEENRQASTGKGCTGKEEAQDCV